MVESAMAFASNSAKVSPSSVVVISGPDTVTGEDGSVIGTRLDTDEPMAPTKGDSVIEAELDTAGDESERAVGLEATIIFFDEFSMLRAGLEAIIADGSVVGKSKNASVVGPAGEEKMDPFADSS